MTTAEEKKLRKDFAYAGYDAQEIEKVIRGLKQVENGQFSSAEEVYKKLYAKMKVHA